MRSENYLRNTLVCWFYMGCWVKIPNINNWWSTEELTMSGVAPLRLKKAMSSKGLKECLDLYVIGFKIILDIMMGSFTCVKWQKHRALTWLKSLIHNGLMYLTKV